MNMEDWLSARTKASPHAIAIISGSQQWTYADLNEQVENICKRLAGSIQPSQHVGVLLPNKTVYICLIHALARIGAVLVPLNTRLVWRELNWQVDQSDCQIVIYSDATADIAHRLASRACKLLPVESLLEKPEGKLSTPANVFQLENLQAIVFTSGTTGKPKGAMLTFANHFWSATGSAFRLGVNHNDRWLSCLPLYHVGGLAVIFRSCLYGTAVVLHERFETASISESLDSQEITLISLVPTMVHRLLDYRQGRAWPTQLRHLLLGGSAATNDLLERCKALKIPVSATYGLTEAASQVATSLSDQTGRKPGSAGKPLIFSSVTIVDKRGKAAPVGQPGEIVVSGPTVMAGYYNDPQATADTLRDGRLHTGDVGYLDEDGDLWVLQRRSDIIISGGENIYPAEVESVISQHPDVAAVCVTGVPDREWGQRVGAMIVLRDGRPLAPVEILEYGRQHLAGYKLPSVIKIADHLPQTASGKIQRQVVASELKRLAQGSIGADYDVDFRLE